MGFVQGTTGNDSLEGTISGDVVDAKEGNDTIYASTGTDSVDGGAGFDILAVDFARPIFNWVTLSNPGGTMPSPLVLTLTATSFYSTDGAINTSLANVERFVFNANYALGPVGLTLDMSAWTGTARVNGTNGNDTITGSANNDSFYTMGGTDTVHAGGGFDVVETAVEAGGAWAYVTRSGGTDYITQNSVNILTATGAEKLGAGSYAVGFVQRIDASASAVAMNFYDGLADDTFIGSAFDDIFVSINTFAGTGTDTYTGGGGNDLFDFTYAAQALNGTIITDMSVGDAIDLNYNNIGTLGTTYTISSFIGSAAFSGVAGQYRYTFSGGQTLVQFDSDGDSVADGTLTIANGRFALEAFDNGNGGNALRIASSNVITGTAARDVIHGTAGADQISALGGNDLIFASSGSDSIDGGTGNDVFSVDFANGGEVVGNLSGPVTFTLTATHFSDNLGVFDTTLANIERVLFNPTYALANRDVVFDASAWVPASGTAPNQYNFANGNDTVTGSAYDEFIYTNGGLDVVNGGGGFDAVGTALDGTSAWATITQVGGTSYVTQNGAHLLTATNVERVGAGNFAASYAQRVDGSASTLAVEFYDGLGNDTFIGSAFDDYFITIDTWAGGGTDTFTGGGGNDFYDFTYAAHAFNGTTITDFAVGDVIDLSFNVQANGATYQIDTFIGSAAFSGVAGQFRYAWSGGQTLVQFDSNGDSVADGTLTIANGRFALVETATVFGGTHGLKIATSNSITGTEVRDIIHGTAGVDQVSALGGNDLIFASSGSDSIDGGAGNDLFSIDFANGGEIVGNLTSAVTFTLTATHFSDSLGVFDTTLANIERVVFNPTYALANRDVVFDASAWAPAGGTGLGQYNFANGNDTVTGSAYDEFIYTNGGLDVVNGGGGFDAVGTALDGTSAWATITQIGGTSYVTQNGAHLLTATNVERVGAGNYAASYAQRVDGSASTLAVEFYDGLNNDTFIGSAFDDYFYSVDNQAGGGTDTYTGGAGNDFYDFSYAAQALNGTIITDFAVGDVIELSFNVQANGAVYQIDTFIGSAAFSGVAGQFRYAWSSGQTLVQFDSNGDSVADGTLTIANGQFALEETTTVFNGTHGLRIKALNTVNGTAGVDNLQGTDGVDQIFGLADNDTLTGRAGNDTLDGGTGADTMSGGLGDDLYFVDNGGDTVVENAGEGTDEVRTALVTYTLGTNVENLTGTSAGGQTLTGNGLANVIKGGAGNDTLNGLAGADTLIGGLGNDVYVVDNAGDVVSENAGEGTDEVRTSLASYTLGANLENLTGLVATGQALTGNGVANVIVGLAGNDTLSGGGGNDTMTGGAGNDVLDGGTGADTMTGGVGNDVYYVDSADVVTELSGEGTDEVRTTRAGYVLADNVENLTGLLATGQNLIGNALANAITGGAGNDKLDGQGGADTLKGGLGNDTYYVDNVGDTVFEAGGAGTDEVRTTLASYQLTVNVENLVGTGTGGQTLIGNGGDNTITGGGAGDVLNGSGGNDTMIGGNGNDIYYVGQTGDVVIEQAGQGNDLVRTTIDFTLPDNVERLRIISTTGVEATGNGLDNHMVGNTGADVMWGMGGVDRLDGVDGNDEMHGGDGGDYLWGGAGDDDLFGDAGNDFLRGQDGNDTLHGGAGIDSMLGGTGNDTLHGDGETDNLQGQAGSDVLWGGAGTDYLTGGTEADTFAFADGDTSADASLADRILDFSQAQGDRLDLSAMDANTLVGGDQAFSFIGASAFAGTGAASAGELRYTFVGAYTFVQGDTDGNGTADFMIRLDGNIPFSGVDVIL